MGNEYIICKKLPNMGNFYSNPMLSTATLGDKSYCPIVSLLTKYADFSSCYITPNRRTCTFYTQECAFETLIESVAARFSQVLLPARIKNKSTATTRVTKAPDIWKVDDKARIYRPSVGFYINLDECTYCIYERQSSAENNVLFKASNNEYINIHIKEEIASYAVLDTFNEEDKPDLTTTQMKIVANGDMKKVRFNLKPEVHLMCTWNFAYQAARKGNWHQHAVDRSRFQMRVQRASLYLNPIFTPEHRNKIYESRFAE